LNTNKYTKQVESFPSPESVVIKGSKPGSLFSASRNLNISWFAKGYGEFRFDSRSCVAQFNLNPNFRLKFKATSRIPWKKSSINFNDGPEGWLGSTPFLPCHYFVHSVGSQCEYEILINENRNSDHISGNGFAHIEGNHGSFFPDGWTWCQTIAVNNEASLSFVGGRFEIAGLKPMNFIVYFRRKNGYRVIFRTTDLDIIKYRIQPTRGIVTISANSANLLRRERLEITVTAAATHSSHDSIKNLFGRPVFIPTAGGFSNSPGCLETYNAVATIDYFPGDDSEETPESYSIPLTALEFGGSFVGKHLVSS